ncbi:hypothetical protein GQ55_1G089100 [Panicum hallii var. hallii]|uniref:Uncharacterized protein n=1 Tax=Panicum hallii var. hallii TaxID=1504633 RepID=A0A2T7F3S1_9POAL|nr:hypothetical protein GQ55_1G089100 [Panicum hallii var. hallii]
MESGQLIGNARQSQLILPDTKLTFRRHHWTADWWIRHGLRASETCRLCNQKMKRS